MLSKQKPAPRVEASFSFVIICALFPALPTQIKQTKSLENSRWDPFLRVSGELGDGGFSQDSAPLACDSQLPLPLLLPAAPTSEARQRTTSTSPSVWPPARRHPKAPATRESQAHPTATERGGPSCAGTSLLAAPWSGRSPQAACSARGGSGPLGGCLKTAAGAGFLWEP